MLPLIKAYPFALRHLILTSLAMCKGIEPLSSDRQSDIIPLYEHTILPNLFLIVVHLCRIMTLVFNMGRLVQTYLHLYLYYTAYNIVCQVVTPLFFLIIFLGIYLWFTSPLGVKRLNRLLICKCSIRPLCASAFFYMGVPATLRHVVWSALYPTSYRLPFICWWDGQPLPSGWVVINIRWACIL